MINDLITWPLVVAKCRQIIERQANDVKIKKKGNHLACETIFKYCKENKIKKSTFYEHVRKHGLIPTFTGSKTINGKSVKTEYYSIKDLDIVKNGMKGGM